MDEANGSQRFAGYDVHRIEAFESLDETEQIVARLIPPLRAAHALGRPLLWCLSSTGRIEAPGMAWMIGLATPSAAPGPTPAFGEDDLGLLIAPSGAVTSPLPAEEARRRVSRCEEWVALEAVLTSREESVDSDELREAILAQLSPSAFACMIHALPATADAIDSELLSLDQVARLGQVEGRAAFASSRTGTELAIERYRDLVAARFVGGWTVEIEVGAPLGQAHVAAELVAAALELPGLSFQVVAERSPPAGLEAWRQPQRHFLVATRQLATLLRSPARELPGVALRQPMPFDMNAESDASLDGARRQVDLGVTLDAGLRPSGRFQVDTATLNRHALVCGATGSGKSQTVQHLLEELTEIGVPWLVIEPAKAEYRSMPARLQAAGMDVPVHVIRLGDPDAPPLGLNPLEPAPGFPLQTHVDMVAALFVASFDAAEPFPQVLAEALRRCYSDLGWVLATGEYKGCELGRPADRGSVHLRYPTLADLQRAARDVVYDVGYGPEVRDNVLGFVDVRLGSLRHGTPGRFFEDGHPLDLDAVHRNNVVVEIEDVGNDLDKAFVIGTVVLRLYEHLRVKGPSAGAGLTHVTVVEEAHRLLRRSEPGARANQAVELFGAMLSEVRAFGEGIVIAEQIPTKILPDVLKNTALQIVHRLPSLEDRAILAGTTNMDEDQSAFVLSLRPGYAASFREGMDAPILLKVDHPGRLASVGVPAPQPSGLRLRLRGVGCDEVCAESPCTGRALQTGPLLARALPELPFWFELVFLSFVSETEVPRPGRVWSAQLRRRLATSALPACALGRMAEATVNARWAQVGDFYDPNRLTRALIAAGQANLIEGDGGQVVTAGFAAGRFLLRGVYDGLLDAGDAEGPHPLTARWRDELGIDLIDAPVPAQRAWIELGPLFSYPGHDRLLSGIAPSQQSGPASRVEDLARPLAAGRIGALAIEAACQRVTPDHKRSLQNISDWFALAGLT